MNLAATLPQLVNFKISAERFLKVLHGLGIEYAMIGAIPASFYGNPRLTQDLDFTSDPEKVAGNFPELIQELEKEGFLLVSTRPTIQELKTFTSLRFIDLRKKTFIDLVLHPKGFRWDSEFLKRRRKEKILPGKIRIWCLSIEDLIIMKIANGEPQDYKDLEGILSRRFNEIDWNYLRKRSREFGLNEHIDEVYKRFSLTK
jgi:hypothetical protein